MTEIILHNIRSAHNVGSIFRTADGAEVTKIYLTGYTPTPVDRFGRVVKEIEKTSLGATEGVLWKQYEDPYVLIEKLKSEGSTVVAVEQDQTSIPYDTFIPPEKTVYIFGNEVDGVDPELCKQADAIIEIPMYGKKESLNVSVTAGIILFQHRSHQKESSSLE